MKVVTAEEMRKIDRIMIDEMGVPGEVLMGYAGKSVADYIADYIAPQKKTAVFCGTGHNGGDGFVAAYFLADKRAGVNVYVAGDLKKITDASKLYLDICRKININIIVLDNDSLNKIDFEKYDLIVDALLGTGFTGTPRGIIKDTICKINACGVKILSVDLPSGLPSDGEAPEGDVVKADYTVTMGLPKVSLVTHPGKQYTGVLHVSEIGFPAAITNDSGLSVDLLDSAYVKAHLSLLKDADFHKGNAGHLLLVGGFDGMEGAIIMSAVSAFETGAGLATLLTTKEARNIIAGQVPELITRTLESFDLQTSDIKMQTNIKHDINNFFNENRRYDAMVIGPGMGRSENASLIFSGIMEELVTGKVKKVLIDGDGLYHLSIYLNKNGNLPQGISFVLTPHFTEASRLIGKTVDEIKKNRLFYAMELAKKCSSVVTLKGPASIITDWKNSLINTTGNPALGTAGSGDVLSGITGSLLLKDISQLEAAGLAVYIHGLAGDLCVEERNVPVMKATDIIKYIHSALDRATK